MRNALENSLVGITIKGTKINNTLYGDDTTLIAVPKEELKELLKTNGGKKYGSESSN